ncbi:hypothetical protein EVA_08584 [gut metagenome]|uniref:Uncharacterized protein n=1 Tax=gut metagenome TaxID=749906 RepID=J9GSR0_9ZZZZ
MLSEMAQFLQVFFGSHRGFVSSQRGLMKPRFGFMGSHRGLKMWSAVVDKT